MYTETSDITLKGVHANKVRTLNDEGAFLHASDCAVILEDSHFMFVGNLSALLLRQIVLILLNFILEMQYLKTV